MINTEEIKDSRIGKTSQLSKNHKKRYHVDTANNFVYYQKFKLLVSEPNNYVLLHVVLVLGMTCFYALTFFVALIVYEINWIVIALHLIATCLLLVLGFKNPGIYLKITQDFDSPSKIKIPFDRDSKPAVNQLAKSYGIPIKSHTISLKFCAECLIFKPPRTVHCWVCNACIANMDHHCPFIGNCVGKGNYQVFFAFVLTLTIKMILAIIQLIIMEVRLFGQEQDRITKRPEMYFGFMLLVFCFVVLCFVGSLLAFHIYLILNSLTTNELCKNTWDTISGNPFKKQVFMNQRNFFFKNIFKFIRGSTEQIAPHLSQNLKKTMVPREKDKSEQYMSEYESEDYVKHDMGSGESPGNSFALSDHKKAQTVDESSAVNHTGQRIISKVNPASYI